MKRTLTVSTLLVLITILMLQPAEAKEVQVGNLKITLPDEITVTGYESGIEPRNCTFKLSVDANPGTTIPLRGGIQFILKDSLGTPIENNYSQALVEGVTHQEIISVFHCSASLGTLKPPYSFHLISVNLPGLPLSLGEVPVKLNFVAPTPKSTPTPTLTPTPTPTPTPKTTPVATPTPTPTVTVTAISKPIDTEAVLIAELATLKAQNALIQTQFKSLQLKLAKICNVKAKPKGC
jgi:hypothetical protein